MDRLTKTFNPDNTLQPSKYYNSFDYGYDTLGNRLYENGFAYSYETGSNRLIQVNNAPYNTVITNFAYDFKGNIKTKLYNKEYAPCNISTMTVNGQQTIFLAFNNNAITTSLPVKVIYDLNYYDNINSLETPRNKHYEWNNIIINPSSSVNIYCDGARSQKVVNISVSSWISSLSSDTAAGTASWYSSSKIKNIKVYNPSRRMDNYSYDSENRLTNINYSDGTCSRYYYDESGMRIKKVENNLATNYLYNGNNVLYEESYSESCSNKPPLPVIYYVTMTSGTPKCASPVTSVFTGSWDDRFTSKLLISNNPSFTHCDYANTAGCICASDDTLGMTSCSGTIPAGSLTYYAKACDVYNQCSSVINPPTVACLTEHDTQAPIKGISTVSPLFNGYIRHYQTTTYTTQWTDNVQLAGYWFELIRFVPGAISSNTTYRPFSGKSNVSSYTFSVGGDIPNPNVIGWRFWVNDTSGNIANNGPGNGYNLAYIICDPNIPRSCPSGGGGSGGTPRQIPIDIEKQVN
jgi:hypothetical protein